MLLQHDLIHLVLWGESIDLLLNTSKWFSMIFMYKLSSINYTYLINDQEICSSANCVWDLGFTLTRTLCPLKHILRRDAVKLLSL